jgi:hypothetical protein
MVIFDIKFTARMDSHYTDVIAVFDIGRTWKRFQLFDKSLNTLHTEEKIIGETFDTHGQPCDDLPAIEAWMQSCLSGVTGRDLYSVRAVNIAGDEGCTTHLQGFVSEIVKGLQGVANPCKCESMSSTTASLIPYLMGSSGHFILASTGIWCTFMNPYNQEPFDGVQPTDGMRGFMSVGSRQIKYSRFILGEIHDSNVTVLDDHFGVTGELYKTIKIKYKKIEKIQANRRGRVFFRHGIPEGFADHDADLTHFLTYADAYHQMMYDLVDECMGSFREIVSEGDSTEIIYVTGGFARNDTFVRILAARIPDKRVYASTIENATSLGAAMEIFSETFDADLPPVYLGLKAIRLSDD